MVLPFPQLKADRKQATQSIILTRVIFRLTGVTLKLQCNWSDIQFNWNNNHGNLNDIQPNPSFRLTYNTVK